MGFSFVSKALLGLITLNEMWLAVRHLLWGLGQATTGQERREEGDL